MSREGGVFGRLSYARFSALTTQFYLGRRVVGYGRGDSPRYHFMTHDSITFLEEAAKVACYLICGTIGREAV